MIRSVWILQGEGEPRQAYATRELAEQASQGGAILELPIVGLRPDLPTTPVPTDFAERRREMIALKEQGFTLRELAKRYGISYQAVQKLIAKGQPKELRRLDWAQVRADREGGMTLRTLAEKHGTTPEYLSRKLKQMGVRKAVAPQ